MKFIPNIPKFQDPATPLPEWFNSRWKLKALTGWNSSLDSSKAGESIANAYHGHAGDLNTVFSSMQDYVGNKNNISSDIQSYANAGSYSDINSFLNAYNADINSLNTYFDSDKKLGESALAHNQLFKKLYASRSQAGGAGTSGNLGYQEGLENTLGSTTWLRRGDMYEKEFDALTDAEKANRTHKVNIGGTDYNVYKKADGTLGVLTTESSTLPAESSAGGASEQGATGNVSTSTGQSSTNLTPGNPYEIDPLEFNTVKKKTNEGYSDWIPLTINRILDILNNVYQSQQLKKTVFPKKVAPHKQAKVTNNYLARTELAQLASEARARAGTQNLTSDINQNLRIRSAAEKAGLDLAAKAAGLKADKFERTTQYAQQVANENNAVNAQVANANALSDAAAMNNIINANMKQSEANTGSFKQYVNDMYLNYGQYLQTKRWNAAVDDYALRLLRAAKAYKDASDLYTKRTSDISAWNQYNTLLADALTSGNDFDNYTDLNKGWGSAEDYRTGKRTLTDDQKALLNNWFMNSQSASALKWRTNWNKYLQQEETLLNSRYSDIQSRLAASNTSLKKMISNQWSNPFASLAHIAPIYEKKGGRLSRFSDFTEQVRKEREGVRRDARRRNDSIQKSVDRRLTQLTQEQLLLLKAVFK